MSVSRTSQEGTFNSGARSHSAQDTPISPASILLDKHISDTWRFVAGTTLRPSGEPRSVTFNTKKYVRYINTRKERQELTDKGDIKYTYWSKDDCATFRQAAVTEIIYHMKITGIPDVKEAMKNLYQPKSV